MTECWADPEERENLLAGIEKYWKNPEAHEKASAAAKARSATPEAQKQFATASAKRWSDPAEHERMSALMKEIYSEPERLKKQSENSKRYRAEHPYTDEDKAQIAVGVKKYWAKIKAVRGLIIALLVTQRRTEKSPETASAFLGEVFKRFSLVADFLLDRLA